MHNNTLTKSIGNLRKELVQIDDTAAQVASQCRMLQVTVEQLKVAILKQTLLSRSQSQAIQEGITSVVRDKQKLGLSLGVAVTSMILSGGISKDKFTALKKGISAFNATAQEFGRTRFAVSLDRDLLVIPCDRISAVRKWVTLESLLAVSDELMTEASQGIPLGTLDNILQRLSQGKKKLVYFGVSS